MVFSEFYSMEPRVAVYLRVSTESQSHDSQEDELNEYCQRRGWKQIEWFRDTASGARQDRKGLTELMARVRRGKVDVILAFKLDRIARSLSHLAQVLAELQLYRVALICPSQGIDTSNQNPAAQLQINILAAVAQFERELITERVRSGILAAQARGVKLGRPSRSDKVMGQVKNLRRDGLKAKDISARLGLPYSSVTEILRATVAE